jgi:hypothetical protein
MSKLEIYVRPLQIFDPEDRTHRHYYYQFLKTGSWKGCPYRWSFSDVEGNLQGQIQRALLERYMDREFKTKDQKPEISVSQNREKSVDSLEV